MDVKLEWIELDEFRQGIEWMGIEWMRIEWMGIEWMGIKLT